MLKPSLIYPWHLPKFKIIRYFLRNHLISIIMYQIIFHKAVINLKVKNVIKKGFLNNELEK